MEDDRKVRVVWESQGFACPRCATPNPDGGSKCGNCDSNVYEPLSNDEQLTPDEFMVFQAVIGRRVIEVFL